MNRIFYLLHLWYERDCIFDCFSNLLVRANFEFINKLGVDRWCFHDRDIAPDGKTLAVCFYSFSVFDVSVHKLGDISNRFYGVIINFETLVVYTLNIWCLLHPFFLWEYIFITSYYWFSLGILEFMHANFFHCESLVIWTTFCSYSNCGLQRKQYTLTWFGFALHLRNMLIQSHEDAIMFSLV